MMELQPEVVNMLGQIGHLIRNQDNRITDQPLFAVMQKREIVTLEGYGHDRIVWVETESGEHAEASRQKANWLDKKFKDGEDVDGWERFAMVDIDEFVTACFTEQGCKDYIAINGHNLKRPFIYAFGSFRNYEFQAVRNFLSSVSVPETSTEPYEQAVIEGQ